VRFEPAFRRSQGRRSSEPLVADGAPFFRLVGSGDVWVAGPPGRWQALSLEDDILYVLEANPRASRTVPFVSKATAVQLAKAAARIAVGETIGDPSGQKLKVRERLAYGVGDIGGNLVAREPELGVNEYIDRRLIFAYPRDRSPTRLSCTPMVMPLPQF